VNPLQTQDDSRPFQAIKGGYDYNTMSNKNNTYSPMSSQYTQYDCRQDKNLATFKANQGKQSAKEG